MNKKAHEVAASNRASQDRFELEMLLTAVDQIKPAVIVEIGVDTGLNIRNFINMWPKATIFGMDYNTTRLEVKEGYRLLVCDSHRQSAFELLQKELDGKLIDFLFIDGDHTIQGCLNDFELYAPLVRPGGIIALHDVNRRGKQWLGKVETRQVFDAKAVEQRHAIFTGGKDAPGTGVIWYNEF